MRFWIPRSRKASVQTSLERSGTLTTDGRMFIDAWIAPQIAGRVFLGASNCEKGIAHALSTNATRGELDSRTTRSVFGRSTSVGVGCPQKLAGVEFNS